VSASLTLNLHQIKGLIRSAGHAESFLLLAPPGVGKSDLVAQAARESGLECRSLLGTQIAPEDVSGIPRIIAGRSVFCPPRRLLPEDGKPFCLLLDDLPACAPDVQKAFYSLLLERRVGEFRLPEGSWVIATGNTAEDRAESRGMSSALMNRVFVLHLRVELAPWLAWAADNGIRPAIRTFVSYVPESLQRPVPRDPVPFSTPRSWSILSRALDAADRAGGLAEPQLRALAFGCLSAEDAALFSAMVEEDLGELLPLEDYFADPARLPTRETALWFVVNRLRTLLRRRALPVIEPEKVNALLAALPEEFRFASLVDLVPEWAEVGAEPAMLDALIEVTGL
jgi:hypothetical protein